MKANLLAGMAVVGLLCAGGASTGNMASGGSHSLGSCAKSARAEARLAKGATAKDPNTVTEARAARMDAQLRSRLVSQGFGVNPATLKPGSVNVRTFVHVITKDDGTGGPKRTMILRQM